MVAKEPARVEIELRENKVDEFKTIIRCLENRYTVLLLNDPERAKEILIELMKCLPFRNLVNNKKEIEKLEQKAKEFLIRIKKHIVLKGMEFKDEDNFDYIITREMPPRSFIIQSNREYESQFIERIYYEVKTLIIVEAESKFSSQMRYLTGLICYEFSIIRPRDKNKFERDTFKNIGSSEFENFLEDRIDYAINKRKKATKKFNRKKVLPLKLFSLLYDLPEMYVKS